MESKDYGENSDITDTKLMRSAENGGCGECQTSVSLHAKQAVVWQTSLVRK